MGAADNNSPPPPDSMRRVKVYSLKDDGKWDDQGTGHVNIDYVEKSDHLSLFVIREDDNETIILHRISSDDIYRKQEDTIISWRDPEFSTEMALSFQETAGCSYIWEHICSIQRNLNFDTLKNETVHELRELPAVELSTLPLILKTVVESGISYQMRLSELILNDQDFFRKLFEVFRICESMENNDDLHMLFKIVRGIILLNNSHIFERLFRDELIMDFIGTLEYDPEVPNVQHHRSFLKEHVVFKEAIPIKNRLALSKIHQTYRIGYVKDVILPRAMDEATVSTLNSMIQMNNATVVTLLKDDIVFIEELFARLRSPTISIESKKKLIFFLHEFCTLSKSLQMVQQLRLSRDLINQGIFDIITDALQSPEKKLVLTGTDILILFLNQDPNLLRSYIVRPEGIPLLGLLIKGMLTDFGDDMHCQFLEILRSLLDSLTISESQSQKETVVEIFYARHLGELVDFITSACPIEEGDAQSVSKSMVSDGKVENQNIVKPEILLNICDLLCFCVLHHPYRIEYNFILNNVIEGVLLLTKKKEQYLVVASVRFVRRVISCQDEHLIAHIVKHNLLKPIVEAFVANGNRYNLLHSAVLELFDYVWKEKLKYLLKYLVESFWGELVNFENLASVHSLRVKYDQSMDKSTTDSTINVLESRKRNDERGMDKEEEDYFNDGRDEEDIASAYIPKKRKVHVQPVLSKDGTTIKPSPRKSFFNSPKSGGLVDYEDDEDDEDYQPPPKKQLESSDAEEVIVKRKSGFKDKNPELPKKQRHAFASLCSKLSQVVLPIKKTASTIQNVPHTQGGGENNSDEENCGEVESASESFTNSAGETLMEDEHAADKKSSDNTKTSLEETRMEEESAADTNSYADIKNSAGDSHLEEEYAADKKGSDDTKSSAEENHMEEESAAARNSSDDITNSAEEYHKRP